LRETPRCRDAEWTLSRPSLLTSTQRLTSQRLPRPLGVLCLDLGVLRKYFSLTEANRTLPLVKRVVADITALHPKWRDLVYKYELAAAQARPDWGESKEQLDLRGAIETIAHQIQDYLLELEQIGCVFKGFEHGLVDFYGKLDGREIFWCWKQGEDRIDHWHDLEAGYAGRQPVPEVVRG